ncbi:AAA family ATPase [bacterium]|nr:AAA family ATPase [bacterium]
MVDITKFLVDTKELRKQFNAKRLKFNNTSEIITDSNPFGQKRAIDALNFGLSIKNKAFNIYVTGPTGCGKTSIIKKVLKEYAKNETPSSDYVYVNNFANPAQPIAIKFKKGEGKLFEAEIESLVKDMKLEIPKAMDTPRTNEKRMNIIKKYQKMEADIYQEITEFTREHSFVLEKSQAGIVARPLNSDGKLMTEDEYANLSDEDKEDVEQRQLAIQKKMDQSARKELKNEKAFKKDMVKFEEDVVSFVITPLIDDISKKYTENEKVDSYLKELKKNILKNSQAFLIKEGTSQNNEKAMAYIEYVFSQYKVNLFVDRADEDSAPVVFETNPTHSNLFGWIEHEERSNGYLGTDFMKIKAGAVHKANGGYLVIQVVDLLKNSFAYDDLKRALRNKKTKVGDSPLSNYVLRPVKKLEPEEIDLNLKVILIGSSYYFALLNHYDEEFARLFKVKSDFDSFVHKNEENIEQFLKFLSLKTKEKEILPLNRGAVAEMIDYSTRISGHIDHLTARLSNVEDILFESNYIAKKNNREEITRKDIERAIESREYRHSRFETIIQETIYDGTILINIEGEKVGEINGLAVYSLDEYSFGIPSKITAQTFAGKSGIINIEREANLSGKIHNKGVAILSGYMGAIFRDITPLNLTASISFEQNYGGVDGDSASSTETYAILSSLSGFPIRQSIAVTGSVNQKGEIQPIGGVNEKIEGFFAICKHFGLTGEQGVMIPHQNIKHLMLKKEVVESVRAGKFHIYAIKNISEGIEVLTGKSMEEVLEACRAQLKIFVKQSIDQMKPDKKESDKSDDKKGKKETKVDSDKKKEDKKDKSESTSTKKDESKQKKDSTKAKKEKKK